MSAKVLHRLSKVLDARSMALMSAKSCSKAILAPIIGYGKSPCFSGVAFLSTVGPDYPLSILPNVDGQEFLECAF
jgi:hypothetical protein